MIFLFGKRIIIINRWSDDFADYQKFINHKDNLVSYIVDGEGRKGINADPELISEIFEVEDLSDINEMYKCSLEMVKKYGSVDKIIALSEFDLEQAASLRTLLSVPGMNQDQVKIFRNKIEMKKRMRGANLKTPDFVDCIDKQNTINFANQIGYPVILKPKEGAASRGVYLVKEVNQLEKILDSVNLLEYECEEYIQGPIFHIDGLVKDNEIVFVKVSKYINTCLEFNKGKPLGSVIIDNTSLNNKLVTFTNETLKALELDNSAFHLEIILKEGVEPIFLEIGARVGGGEIPFLIRDIFGIDLVEEWVKIQLGTFSGLQPQKDGSYGGFLMIPEPQESPCKVLGSQSLMGRIPTLYKEIIPSLGEILDGNGGIPKLVEDFYMRVNVRER